MKDGIDMGPCLSYWRLSYRRKFIRTLWMAPFVLFAIGLAATASYLVFGPALHLAPLQITSVAALIMSMAWIVQAGYNLVRWRMEHGSSHEASAGS